MIHLDLRVPMKHIEVTAASMSGDNRVRLVVDMVRSELPSYVRKAAICHVEATFQTLPSIYFTLECLDGPSPEAERAIERRKKGSWPPPALGEPI